MAVIAVSAVSMLCAPLSVLVLLLLSHASYGQDSDAWSLGLCNFQLGESCDSGSILYYMFSSSSPERPQLLDPYDPQPREDLFDPARKTFVVVHGYVGHVNFSTTVALLSALLRAGDSNVLVVDWGALSGRPCYPAAVFNTLFAGRCVAQLLLGLLRKFPAMALARVHALGFSLGAHVAAFSSNHVRSSAGAVLGRITGLDPALPLFATLKSSWKLDPSDADFVDVIHTNVGVFGKVEAMGHADFYVNGGSVQPACAGQHNVPLCSHMMAPVYYAESVQSSLGFWATPCDSYLQYMLGLCPSSGERALMGEHCDTRTRGVFFVNTGSTPPYALG